MVHSRQGTGVMKWDRVRPRMMAVAGGAATLITMGAVLAGCGSSGNQAPSTSTTTTTTTTTSPPATTAPPASPTEKNLSPTGGNLFTPPVIAPPAPTEPPGVLRKN